MNREQYLEIEKYVVRHNKHFGFYPPLVKLPDGTEVTFDEYEQFIGHVHKIQQPVLKHVITNLDDIMDELAQLEDEEQFYALRDLLDRMSHDAKRAFLHTKEFMRWCKEHHDLVMKMQERGDL